MGAWSRFLLFFFLLGSLVSMSQPVFAQSAPQNPTQLLAQTLIPFDPSKYPGVNMGNIIGAGTGSQRVVNTVIKIYDSSLKILGPILVLLLAWFAIRLVIAGGNEEKFSEVSRHFLYLMIGTAFVVFAKFLSETFILYSGTGDTATSFISDSEQVLRATNKFRDQIGILIKFLRYVLSGLAVFYIVKSGATILFSADDEMVNKQKDVFLYGFVGFLLIMISSTLIDVFFNLQSFPAANFGSQFTPAEVNITGGVSLLSNLTSLFLAGMSGLFLFMLVAGGVLYAFSGGNEERGQKATKIITGSIIGLVIAFSSYTIVAEFSAGGGAVRNPTAPSTPLVPPPSTPAPSTSTPSAPAPRTP